MVQLNKYLTGRNAYRTAVGSFMNHHLVAPCFFLQRLVFSNIQRLQEQLSTFL